MSPIRVLFVALELSFPWKQAKKPAKKYGSRRTLMDLQFHGHFRRGRVLCLIVSILMFASRRSVPISN